MKRLLHQTFESSELADSNNITRQSRLSCKNYSSKYLGKYVFWSAEDRDSMMKSKHPDIYEQWRSLPLRVMQVDVWKYAILYEYGGIYVEMDLLLKGNAPNFFTCQSVTCCTENADNYCCWLLAAPPRSALILRMLSNVKANIKLHSPITAVSFYENDKLVQKLTGSSAFTHTIKNWIGGSNLVQSDILPATLQKYPGLVILPRQSLQGSIAIHTFMGDKPGGWTIERDYLILKGRAATSEVRETGKAGSVAGMQTPDANKMAATKEPKETLTNDPSTSEDAPLGLANNAIQASQETKEVGEARKRLLDYRDHELRRLNDTAAEENADCDLSGPNTATYSGIGADNNIFVIDCQPLQHETRGIGQYGVNLVNGLVRKYRDEFSFYLLINNFLSDELINNGIIKQTTTTIHKINFENVSNSLDLDRNVSSDSNEKEYETLLTDYINNLKPKYFLNLSGFDTRKIMVNIGSLSKNIRSFSIIHDLIPLRKQWIYKTWTLQESKDYTKKLNSLKTYDKLLSNSEFTKEDCSDVFNNIETIGTIVKDYKYSFSKEHEQAVLAKFNIDKKFIYCQTAFDEHKGLSFLYEQYLQLSDAIKNDVLLVLGTDISEDYRTKHNINEENVIITGYLSNDDLHILHEKAWLFVFPSTYEGFGIPPVEAMKHNKPVIVANNTSLVEVIGNDNFMFSHDGKSCAELITSLYGNKELYNECIENSLRRKDLFDEEKVLGKLLSAITNI